MKPTSLTTTLSACAFTPVRRDRHLYRQLARALGGVWDMRVLGVRPWASATFTGARHRLYLRIADTPENAARIAALPEYEFQLHRAIVADCCVASREPVLMESADGHQPAIDLEVELLTIID